MVIFVIGTHSLRTMEQIKACKITRGKEFIKRSRPRYKYSNGKKIMDTYKICYYELLAHTTGTNRKHLI